MKILNIQNSKNIDLYGSSNYLELQGDESDVFLFYPNLCAHKAGIPEINSTRKQLMLQLNPAKKWSYSKLLYDKQFRIEPKFPLKDIFESEILL